MEKKRTIDKFIQYLIWPQALGSNQKNETADTNSGN